MELISNKTMQGDAHHAELLAFLMEQHGLRQFKALA